MHVGFFWRANGGTTSTNDEGSIESTVQVDPSGGFSIVTYTANAANATIGHGLSRTPSFIWVKKRTSSTGSSNPIVWAKGLGTDTRGYVYLDGTGAAGADSLWNNTAPTSDVFSVNSGTTEVNNPSGATYIAYCFADTEGYIKSGVYSGTGRVDGGFAYTGFEPAFIMVKAIASGTDWVIFDTSRNPYNGSDNILRANEAAAEGSGSDFTIDILSNGWKARNTNAELNADTADMIYLAFAKNPGKYATAR